MMFNAPKKFMNTPVAQGIGAAISFAGSYLWNAFNQ